ncbi:MAG: peptide chain release factor N(5)-glutamine methyltransferase [Alphaproteobacteria bacterium]
MSRDTEPKVDIETLLANGADCLGAAGIEAARLEARVLLGAAMGVEPDDLAAGRAPVQREVELYRAMLARRGRREPVAYILGKREFWSLDFAVGRGVLVPRPESETLVEAALKGFPGTGAGLRVLDLGTGSGCLLIAFLKERPQAEGVGVETADDAATWAERNLRAHELAVRADIVRGGWDAVQGEFDIVLCNPPYVSEREFASLMEDVARYEPRSALVGGKDGLDAYRQLAPQIARRLAPRGRAYVELGKGQASPVAAIFRNAGLVIREIAVDLMKIPRVLVASLPQ